MKKYFMNPSRKDALLLALMYLAFGLVLCFFSGSLLITIVRILGIALIVYGCYELYIYFVVHKSTDMSPMIIGIPSVILGLVLACWPNMLISFFPIIAGILLLFNSITQIQRSLVMRSAGISSWVMTLVMSLVMLAVAVFLIVRPMNVISFILKLTGAALIVEAIVVVIDVFSSRRA